MERRDFLKAGLVGVAAVATRAGAAPAAADAGSSLGGFEEATVDALRAAQERGELSAVQLTRAYLARIDALNLRGPALHAVIEVNPDAESIARALDEERKAKGPRGPLHGIPVMVKDNVDTGDKMMTTAGSLALAGVPTPDDAEVVKRLRAAGCVLLGKTNLSEWANFRSTQSTSGWSARGGLTLNPYSLDRTPSGSSSGSAVAVAANLCAVAVGSETDGSVVAPSSNQAIVGLKPTVGLVSRTGIIPISASQDTAGPMARTVRDVALLLGAMVSADAADAATQAKGRRALTDYTQGLSEAALKGARLGVARSLAGHHAQTSRAFEAALEELKKLGAELVDVDLPSGNRVGDPELEVLLYEFKDGLASYLAKRRPASPVKSLADVIDFDRKHADTELRWFGQELFEQAQAKGPLTSAPYVKALKTCRELTRAKGIDAAVAAHRLDALVTVASGPPALVDLVYGDRDVPSGTTPAAVAGYPSLSVPMGDVSGLPVGLMFFGPAWSEAKLLALGYAYEQATHHRKPPTFPATLGLNRGA